MLLGPGHAGHPRQGCGGGGASQADRKSTRLNSSHITISYAVFCLKKKKQKQGAGVIRYPVVKEKQLSGRHRQFYYGHLRARHRREASEMQEREYRLTDSAGPLRTG